MSRCYFILWSLVFVTTTFPFKSFLYLENLLRIITSFQVIIDKISSYDRTLRYQHIRNETKKDCVENTRNIHTKNIEFMLDFK